MTMPVKTPRTRVVTITCGSCGDEVFSRARHDFRSCSCRKVHIDGGFDYTKAGFHPDTSYRMRHRYVHATRAELFDDWNRNIDKFGKITPKCPSKKTALTQKRPSKKDKCTKR